MRKILERCPSCGGKLSVTRMSCTECETVIHSRYDPCTYCKLQPESMKFLEVFIKKRGNVKEMERELKESYWVIRSKINDLIQELGFEVEPDETVEAGTVDRRREILEQLDRGEITATEATDMLSKMKT